MKNAQKINALLQISGTILFASSFFVEDNKKAVHRRWISLGLVVGGATIGFISRTNIKIVK